MLNTPRMVRRADVLQPCAKVTADAVAVQVAVDGLRGPGLGGDVGGEGHEWGMVAPAARDAMPA